MTTLRDLIRDVLSRHGLSMDDGVDGGLLIGKVTGGREGGDTKKVAVAIKTGFTQHWDIEDLKEQMDKAGISEGVFIALGNFSGKASDLAASSGIIIWERERFEREVGRVMLYQALGFQEIGEDDGDVTGVIGTKDMKGLGLTEHVPEFSIETMDGVKVVPPTVVDIATGAASDGAAAEGKGSAPKVPPQQQAPQPTLPPGGLLLGMKVDKDGAAKIASDIVKNAFTVEPKIIPYHLFDFICLIEMKGLGPIVRRGLVGINALTGEPERWNRQLEDGASGLGDASFYGLVKGPPEMGADACTDRAKEFVQGINTITVAQKEVKEHVTVYEKRRVSPKMDAVNVTYRGLVYLPVWSVLGTNRSVTVDAHDGRILNESEGTQRRTAGTATGEVGGGSGGNDDRGGRA